MLVSFEGIDGSGKTTQLGLLYDRLLGIAVDTVALREPGGTVLSEAIRGLLLDPAHSVDPVAELLLFSAARAQLASERIRPALAEGKVLLLDRFYDSTTAYQGYGRGLMGVDVLDQINRVATGGLVPDLTFYFDVDVETAYARRASDLNDRMERSGKEFFRRVREGYLALAALHPQRFVTLDASQPLERIHAAVWEHTARTYGRLRGRPLS